MRNGLNTFVSVKKSISAYLFYKILGKEEVEKENKFRTPFNLSVKGLPKLNVYQTEAVKKALASPLCMIQGPPGTGKTVVSATLVYQLCVSTQKQILVCAPSNIAVEHLAEKIEKTGLNVVSIFIIYGITKTKEFSHISYIILIFYRYSYALNLVKQ